jgi:spore coat protein CotF
MQEKEMVNDVLCTVKSSLSNYGRVIGECANQELRQTIQQIRNEDEHFQWQLFKVAEQKNYYKPAQKATDHQVQQLRSEITQETNPHTTGSTVWRSM